MDLFPVGEHHQAVVVPRPRPDQLCQIVSDPLRYRDKVRFGLGLEGVDLKGEVRSDLALDTPDDVQVVRIAVGKVGR